MSTFSSYRSQKPQSSLLTVGENVVALLSVVECTSFNDVRYVSGEGLQVIGDKLMTQLWATPTPQVAILVGNESGVLTHRFNQCSYMHWSDLTEEEIKSGIFTEVSGYACKMINGKLDRIEKPSGIASCNRIIESFLFALANGEEGIDGDALVDTAIAEKREFVVNVIKERFDDKDQLRIHSFKPLKDYTKKDTAVEVSKTVMSDLES